MKKEIWVTFLLVTIGCGLNIMGAIARQPIMGMVSMGVMISPIFLMLAVKRPLAISLVPLGVLFMSAIMANAAVWLDSPVVGVTFLGFIGTSAALTTGIVSWWRNQTRLHNASLGWVAALMVLVGASWYMLPGMF